MQHSQRDSRTLEAARITVPKRVGVAKAEFIHRIRTYIYVFITVSLVHTCVGVCVRIHTYQAISVFMCCVDPHAHLVTRKCYRSSNALH